MNKHRYEIRTCRSCGLRYPLTSGHSFGERCPLCLGKTVLIHQKEVDVEHMTRTRERRSKTGFRAILLDNIRSAWNVGSILRSADGFGFDHAYLCGITPTPENEAVTKTSLGAEEYVTWSHHKDAVKLIHGLKKEGWNILALEEDERSKKISRLKQPAEVKTVLILGSEVTGVDPGLLDLAGAIVHIPMRGQKRSLNVAIAFSVAAYALFG
ncbi:MAG TPA: RNA methyltransferase [Anaerolineae bacterium]|nr:RNA methyltransferase [Anaerolineae bacterium]HRJ56930.1 TrmH family RNA methyltransferase [Anaerolineales bacterium]